jgi:diketogulonate reductase-like aldo/keto reductase
VTYRDNNRVHLILVVKGIVVLPKSVTPVRITSNFRSALTAANMLRFNVTDFQKLDGLAASGKQKR